ncbi:MAG: hypothetical protein ACRYFZ_09220 [Janthinobacterium lividum]
MRFSGCILLPLACPGAAGHSPGAAPGHAQAAATTAARASFSSSATTEFLFLSL